MSQKLEIDVEFLDGDVVKETFSEIMPLEASSRRIRAFKFKENRVGGYGALTMTLVYDADNLDIYEGRKVKIYFNGIKYYEGYISSPPKVTRLDEPYHYTHKIDIVGNGIFYQMEGIPFTAAIQNSVESTFDYLATNTVELLESVFMNNKYAGDYLNNNRPLSSTASPKGYTDIIYSAAKAPIPNVAISNVKFLRSDASSALRMVRDRVNGSLSPGAEEYFYWVDENGYFNFKQGLPPPDPIFTFTIKDPPDKEFDSTTDVVDKVTESPLKTGIVNELIANETVITLSGVDETDRLASIKNHGLKQYTLPKEFLNVPEDEVVLWYAPIGRPLYSALTQYTIPLNDVKYRLAPPYFAHLNGYVEGVHAEDSSEYINEPFISVEYTLIDAGISTSLSLGQKRPNISLRKDYINPEKAQTVDDPDTIPPTGSMLGARPDLAKTSYEPKDNPMYIGTNARDNRTVVSSVNYWYSIMNQSTDTWGTYVSLGAGVEKPAPDAESGTFWEYSLTDGKYDFSEILVKGDIFKIKTVMRDPAGNIGSFENEYMYNNLVPTVIVSVFAEDYDTVGSPTSLQVDYDETTTTFDLKITTARPELVKVQGTTPSESDGVYLYYNQTELHTVTKVDTATETYWVASGLPIPSDGNVVPAQVTITNRAAESTLHRIYVKGVLKKPTSMGVELKDNTTTPSKDTTTTTEYTDDIKATGVFWEDGHLVFSTAADPDVVLSIYDANDDVEGFDLSGWTPSSRAVTYFDASTTPAVVEFDPATGVTATPEQVGTFGHFRCVTANGFGLTKDKVYEMTWTIRKRVKFLDVTGLIVKVEKGYPIEGEKLPFKVVTTPIAKKADDSADEIADVITPDIVDAKKELVDGVFSIKAYSDDPDEVGRGPGIYQSPDSEESHSLLTSAAQNGTDSSLWAFNQNDTDAQYHYWYIKGGATLGNRGAIRYDATNKKMQVLGDFDEADPPTPKSGDWIDLAEPAQALIEKVVATKNNRLEVSETSDGLVFTADTGGTPTVLFTVSTASGSEGEVIVSNAIVPDTHDSYELGADLKRFVQAYIMEIFTTNMTFEFWTGSEWVTKGEFVTNTNGTFPVNIGMGFRED